MLRRVISIGLICILVLGFSGCGKKETKGVVADPATNVTLGTVEKGDINKKVSYTGEIKSTSVASVSAKVSGNIEKIYAEVGDYVKAGQVLAVLDDTQYVQAYNQAEASIKSAQASRNSAIASQSSAKAMKQSAEAAKSQAEASKIQAEASKTQAEAARSGAEAAKNSAQASYNNVTDGSLEQSKVSMNQAVANAQSAYDTALDNYNRQKALFDIGAVSKVALDSAETSLNSAKVALDTAKTNAQLNESVVVPQTQAGANAGVNQAEAGIKQADAGINQADAGITQANAGITQANAGITQAEAGIKQADAGVKQAEAGINQAEVAVNIAKTNIENCTIKAPISGYITSRNAVIGQMASPGVELFSIKNSDMLDVEVSVTETVISFVNLGDVAKVAVKSAKLDNIKGKISVVSVAKNEATGMFTVKVSVPNDDGKIKIGMMADVSLPTESAEDVLTVPYDALVLKDGKHFVYVASDNKAEKREVEIGINDGERAEVVSGLKKGEHVVVEGKDFLSEKNNKIRIVKDGNK